MQDGKVYVATYALRMGESPERFLRDHGKKMENDRKTCWFGQLSHRDFRPDPSSEVFVISRDDSSESFKYHVKYLPERDSLLVDIIDMVSLTISRAEYHRFELR